MSFSQFYLFWVLFLLVMSFGDIFFFKYAVGMSSLKFYWEDFLIIPHTFPSLLFLLALWRLHLLIPFG